MFVLAMDDNVFVLLEDPAAPTRTDLLQQVSDAPSDSFSPSLTTPSHYRNTFMTLSPPGSFEQLLSQLRARWISTRQSGASSRGQKGQGTGQQLLIEGQVFSIGSDWLVRAGNVILAGSAKGMLIEAEYLPLPVLHTQSADGTSELVSNLLTSVLPIIPDAKTVAINVSDPMWDEVLWNAEDEESAQIEKNKQENDADDIYVSADDPLVIRKGDWIGVDRDRRSAFLIIGALRQEGLV
ncbi:hypothetical protein AcW2_006193 [Taiwanofungus camphoratus]|nr:hypothetical protein AcW2_006193 [Antrodia cinnamomea]